MFPYKIQFKICCIKSISASTEMELWVPLAGAHIADIRKCQVSLTISNIQNSEIKFY